MNLNLTPQQVTVDQSASACNVSCNGGADGEAGAMVAGGCASDQYLWSNGATGAVASGLSTGVYAVEVTDSRGCKATATVALTKPDPLLVRAGPDETVYFVYTPLSCTTLSGISTRGYGPAEYTWEANGSAAAMTFSNSVCPSTSTNYNLVVIDANGCQSIS
jgi:hypothetical protein